jgi:hypothetical protein
MVEFTFLKLHVEDASFTAHAPFSSAGDGSDAAGETEDDSEETDGASDRRLFPLLVGLAFLVVAAVALQRLRGGDDGEDTE